MAVNKGDIRTSANYDVQIQAPLDARAVRPTKADLINKESWSYDGSTIYAYEGMQVYVEDEKKTYYLKDISRLTAADYSGWELMGTGAGQEIEVIDNLNSTDTTAALSANQGRVIADELAGKQDLLMDGINIKTINGENITGRGNIVIEGGGTPVEVINSLESESTTAALSANQGKVLNEGKQDALVSGTNIKTINNQSILGEGNITIEGGGSGGGLETRILYVPEMTAAGSELTAEEKAYNVETVSKMLAGTARAALKVDLLDFFYYTTTNIVDLYGFGGVGAVISFGNPLGNMIVSSAFVISPEGDILLNIFDSPTINVGNAEVLEKLYWSIGYADVTSRVPALYYNDILLQEVEVDTDEVRAKGVYQDSSGKRVIRVTANQDGGEITEDVYPMEIYLTPSSSSELNNNKLWVSGYASSDSIKKPRILDNGVSLQAYYSLMIEVDSEQTHADFTIYRNGVFEVWRILASDGSASLIETIPISGGGGSNVFVFPEEVLSDEYTADNPYSFSSEKSAEFDAAILNPSSVYVVYQNINGNVSSLQVQISFTGAGQYGTIVTYLMGYLFIYFIHFTIGEDGILRAYRETIKKQL